MKLLEFIDVVQKFPNGTIGLNEVNLKIEKGEFVYIIGQSGAGKSTFTKLILREYKTKTGKVVVDGLDIKKFKRKKYPKSALAYATTVWSISKNI